jgi:predicted DNA binding protein
MYLIVMWIARFKMDGEKALLGGLCKKYQTVASAFPFCVHSEPKGLRVYFTLFLFAEKEKKKKFIAELKKSGRIIDIENNGDFIIGQIKEKNIVKSMYNYNIFHTEPVKFDKDGIESWSVASWDKKDLVKFANNMEKLFKVKMLQISQEKISNVSVLTVYPELTVPQKRAIELAIEHGYYEIPRKIELKDLANAMKVCYSTYQVHLRKAEKKLLPFFFSKSG